MKLEDLLQPHPADTFPQPLFVENADLLIVEDEEPIRQLLQRLLEHHGYSCTLAANAREARAHLAERDFALLLCDVNLPGESGMDLVRQVLSESPTTAAIMVTGLDSQILANAALEAGAID